MCPRINPDPTVNDFGFKLLTLCKSSGLRILNGRHPDGNSNDFIFAGSRGLSVVDYIVTTPDIFPYLKSFEVADFNIFSDHAPLYSVLQCKTIPVKKKDAISHSYSSLRTFKWSDDNLHIAREALLVNMDELNHTLDNLTDDSAQNSIDDSINRFSSVLTNIMSPFFEVKNSNDPRSNSFPSSASTHSYRVQPSVPHVDKPWFTDELKNIRRIYLTALRTFNSDKSVFNHERLRSTKKAYKSLEGRLKRQFQRVEGDMLHNLRKSNPKAFFKRFAKRRVSCKKEQLPAFLEHFRDLSSATPTVDGARNVDIDNDTAVYNELDADITSDEIRQCKRGLQRGKSHGDDCILNEFLLNFVIF